VRKRIKAYHNLSYHSQHTISALASDIRGSYTPFPYYCYLLSIYCLFGVRDLYAGEVLEVKAVKHVLGVGVDVDDVLLNGRFL
jgi:hypothetical protein